MACGCGGGKGSIKSPAPPIYHLQSDPNEDAAEIYVQSTMQISSKTFRRIFNSGSQVKMPESYVSELIDLGAQVLLR